MTYDKTITVHRMLARAGYAPPMPQHANKLIRITLTLQALQNYGVGLGTIHKAIGTPSVIILKRLRDAASTNDYKIPIKLGHALLYRFCVDTLEVDELLTSLHARWPAFLAGSPDAEKPVRQPAVAEQEVANTFVQAAMSAVEALLAEPAEAAVHPFGIEAGAEGRRRGTNTRRRHAEDKAVRLSPHVQWIKDHRAGVCASAFHADFVEALGWTATNGTQPTNESTRLSKILRSDDAGWARQAPGSQRGYCAPEAFILDVRARMEKIIAAKSIPEEFRAKANHLLPSVNWIKANYLVFLGDYRLRSVQEGLEFLEYEDQAKREAIKYLERIFESDEGGWVKNVKGSKLGPVSFCAPESFLTDLIGRMEMLGEYAEIGQRVQARSRQAHA